MTKKHHIIPWFKWKKNTFTPKNTMNTLNKEIIKPTHIDCARLKQMSLFLN
jgi:hypothetical protein